MRVKERVQSLRHNETGAVAMIVAVVVSAGVLMGAAAISIDVGSLFAQRRQVQNGADAAAFALARTCVLSGACMVSTASSLSTLAGQNGGTTLGDASNVAPYREGICAKNLPAATATDLPLCGDSTGTFVDCPAMPAGLDGVAYVEAHTQTLVSGKHLLPPIVAQSLGYGGANVQACARVAFGPAQPSAQNTLPLSMSYCAWKDAVGYVDAAHPGTFQNPPKGADPGYDTVANPWPATEVSVKTAMDDSTTCETWNGHTAPGGFSWLDRFSGTCSSNVVDGWVGGNTGNSYYCDLSAYYGKMVFIPVFDCVADAIVDPIIPAGQPNATNCTTSAHGAGNTNYHIVGYAAFYVSGWHFSSESKGSIRPPHNPPCPAGSDRCLTGWFTQALMNNVPPAPPTGTTPDFGPKAIKAVG